MIIANVALRGMNNYGSKLCGWLKERSPDIVTIQKIGSKNPFPKENFCNIGYKCWFRDHKKYYRGVAILAHRDFLSHPGLPPPKELDCKLQGTDENEARFLTVRIGELSISSVYAPVPKPTIAPTVDWLNCLRAHVCKEGFAQRKSLLCGDFNVPKVDDKSQGKLKLALKELKGLGFLDLYREKNPNKKGNTRGCGHRHPSRLHLILASASLAQDCRGVRLDINSGPRKDAPPLIADFDVEV